MSKPVGSSGRGVERPPEERALDRLILELRDQPCPNLDWQRLEARLQDARLQLESAPAERSLLGRLRLPALGLLAVATVASVATLATVIARRPGPLPVLPAKPTAKLSPSPLNGDQLAPGTRLTAGNQPLVVEHAGRALWTLEPHATAVVSDAGEFLTVKLETGALAASVVPNPKPETFAVEVEGTRVAVHGTSFRVERIAERVQVEVSEGTVAVEASGSHSSPAFLLRRNSRGSFALDGRTGSVEGNASAVVAAGDGRQSHRTLVKAAAPARTRPSPPALQSAKPEVSAAPIAPAPPLPVQPSIADIETGVSSAVELMNRCFSEHTHTSGNRVSASTALTLSVAGDGSIQSVTFEPPLAPAVEDCAVSGLRPLTFTRSVEGVTFTRLLELSR
ncbi:MAG TPA: FecR domain-containing protein [Polyangiaceae bacterium]|nr:FecR domain-containing protein [Polyangiaceae bacterium]